MVTIEDKFTDDDDEIDIWYKASFDGLAKCMATYTEETGHLEIEQEEEFGMAFLALNNVYHSVYFYVWDDDKLGDLNFQMSVRNWSASRASAIDLINDWYESVNDGLSKCAATIVDKFGLDSFDEYGGEFYRHAIQPLANIKIDMYYLFAPGKLADVITFDEMFFKYIKE